jgi:hypothetical protein
MGYNFLFVGITIIETVQSGGFSLSTSHGIVKEELISEIYNSFGLLSIRQQYGGPS